MEKTDGLFRFTILPPNTLPILSEALMFFRGLLKMRTDSKRMAGKDVLSMQSLQEKVDVENFMHVTGALQMTWDSRFFSRPPVSSLVDGSM
jgi:hypothetical protein